MTLVPRELDRWARQLLTAQHGDPTRISDSILNGEGFHGLAPGDYNDVIARAAELRPTYWKTFKRTDGDEPDPHRPATPPTKVTFVRVPAPKEETVGYVTRETRAQRRRDWFAGYLQTNPDATTVDSWNAMPEEFKKHLQLRTWRNVTFGRDRKAILGPDAPPAPRLDAPGRPARKDANEGIKTPRSRRKIRQREPKETETELEEQPGKVITVPPGEVEIRRHSSSLFALTGWAVSLFTVGMLLGSNRR